MSKQPDNSGLPVPRRARVTDGSKKLAEYADRHGFRPVSWYIPRALHTALSTACARVNMPLQAIVTWACEAHYGNPRVLNLPPLVPPTPTKSGDHVSFTWYAPADLHTQIKVLAAQLRSSAQQLITSAVVEACKGAPEIAELGITTGVAPYARSGDTTEELIPRAARR